MGAEEVAVGCPHRLGQYIGPWTRLPCAACGEHPPGFPRVAIALTIRRPQGISSDALRSMGALRPKPPKVDTSEVSRFVADLSCEFRRAGERIAEAYARFGRGAQAALRATTIETTPIQITMMSQPENNSYLVKAEQAVRFRTRMQMDSPRRIVP